MKNIRVRNADLFHNLRRIELVSLVFILLVHLSCVNKGTKNKYEVSRIFHLNILTGENN